jgi:hypothetical protein
MMLLIDQETNEGLNAKPVPKSLMIKTLNDYIELYVVDKYDRREFAGSGHRWRQAPADVVSVQFAGGVLGEAASGSRACHAGFRHSPLVGETARARLNCLNN